MNDLRKDIEIAINAHSAENGSDTPDFILAKYLTASLAAFDEAVNSRSQWYGVHSFDLNVKDKVVTDEKSDIPESDISDVVSVQPLVADTGKIFYYAYEDDGPLHILRIESDTVTPNVRGGDVIEWRDVLDALSSRVPMLVVGIRPYSASETVPSLRNQVALNNRHGRANFMIVNKNGFDWLRADHLIPIVPSEPRWTVKRPSFVGEYDGMKVYYDNSITNQIIGYRGVLYDSGVVVAEYDGYHCVKLVNPSYYIRFDV